MRQQNTIQIVGNANPDIPISTNGDEIIVSKINQILESNPEYFSEAQSKRRDNLHSLLKYPAMMVPSVQRELIGLIKSTCPHIGNMWDPFIGGGTSGVAAIQEGLNVYGQDINPLALLLTQVKTGAILIESLDVLSDTFLEKLRQASKPSKPYEFKNIDKWFNPDIQLELTRIRMQIQEETLIDFRRFLWVIFAETIRLTSNDRTTTFKLHARSQAEIENRQIKVLDLFENLLRAGVTDALAFSQKAEFHTSKPCVQLRYQDARETIPAVDWPSKFDLVVTSPPYGDNISTITYGQFSYLQLQWIPMEDILDTIPSDILRTTHEIDERALGGKSRGSRFPILSWEDLFHLAEGLRTPHAILSLENKSERINKLQRFASDFYLACANVHSQIKQGHYSIWTIGNRRIGTEEIRNDEILESYLKNLGATVIHKFPRSIKSKRMPNQNNGGATIRKEEIMIFRHGA
jgi:hypothetical protein